MYDCLCSLYGILEITSVSVKGHVCFGCWGFAPECTHLTFALALPDYLTCNCQRCQSRLYTARDTLQGTSTPWTRFLDIHAARTQTYACYAYLHICGLV